MKLEPSKLRAAEQTMVNFPKGDIFAGSKPAMKAMQLASSIGPGISPITPRAAFQHKKTP